MKKFCISRFVSLVMACVMLVSVCVFADGIWYTAEEEKALETGTGAFPTLSCESYVTMDLKTGEVLYSKNENTSLPMASTTKMMTALIVVEREDLDRIVTVDEKSCGIEGSSVNLYKGEKISIRDLLYALMLESANDAAVCLARSVSGSVEEFATLMNEKAKELGMTGSNFVNPHGLEDPEHYSTALDLALLWQHAMKNETLRQIVSTKNYKIELENGEGYRFLSNHNKLLKSYDSCIGGKTGFTKKAGRCLVSVCEKDSVEIITVTLNDPNDWEDHKNLFEYAISQYSRAKLAGEGEIIVDVAVVGGKKDKTVLSNRESLEISVRDIGKVTSTIEAPRFLYAPVVSGDNPVGRAVFYYNGKEIASLDLYSLEEVEIKEVKVGFFQKIWNFITGK